MIKMDLHKSNDSYLGLIIWERALRERALREDNPVITQLGCRSKC